MDTENKAKDSITRDSLQVFLPEERMNAVVCLESVDSTNKYIKELAAQGACEGLIVIANTQTQGRGRLGRTFLSPADSGIYLSALFRPKQKPFELTSLTAWTAVAVAEAIGCVCGVCPKIKWVNDLVLNRKKVCGILTELSVDSASGLVDYVVIGIGVNVNQKEADFPEELKSIASSVREQLPEKAEILRAELAAEIIRKLDRMFLEWPMAKEEYLEKYRKNCITVGQEVRVISPNGERPAVATGVDEEFSLLVKYEDGSEGVVSSGEVSVRGMYGYV